MNRLKMILIATILLTILSCSNSKSDNSPYDGINYQKSCEEFDALAIKQKAILSQIRAKFKDDKKFISQFNEEQISWIQYQNKRLRALYPKDWDRTYRKDFGKSTFNGCKCKELARLSKIRNADLLIYLEGPDAEQEECPIQGYSIK